MNLFFISLQTLNRINQRLLYLRSTVWAGALAGLPGCSWPCWAGCSPGWRRVRSGSGCTGRSWPGCKNWSPRRPTLPWPPCRSHRSSGRSNPFYTWRSAGANTGLQTEKVKSEQGVNIVQSSESWPVSLCSSSKVSLKLLSCVSW